MATPLASTKSVSGISNGVSARPAYAPPFHPPAALSKLQFLVPHLAGSIGRVTAQSPASPALIAALTVAAEELLNVLVDPSKPALSFIAEVEALADHARTSFSGNLGAGASDLYMCSLGYAFRCNGRELVAPPTKVFDLAYDGPVTGGKGIVAVEAKGSIRSSVTATAIQTTAVQGYQNQVDSHVGQVLNHAPVLHGYAIAIGGPPTTVPVSMHVQETDQSGSTPAPSGAPIPPRGPRFSPNSPTLYRPNARIALGSYQAVFRLMNAGGIVAAIDAARRGVSLSGNVQSDHFDIVNWRGGDYVVRAAPSGSRPSRAMTAWASFGLRLDIAQAFFSGLQQLLERQSVPTQFPVALPVRPLNLRRDAAFDDGGAEFPDGLAYFGRYYEDAETTRGGGWIPFPSWGGGTAARQTRYPTASIVPPVEQASSQQTQESEELKYLNQ